MMRINVELVAQRFNYLSASVFGTPFAYCIIFLVVVAANNVALNRSKVYYQALVARSPLLRTELI